MNENENNLIEIAHSIIVELSAKSTFTELLKHEVLVHAEACRTLQAWLELSGNAVRNENAQRAGM